MESGFADTDIIVLKELSNPSRSQGGPPDEGDEVELIVLKLFWLPFILILCSSTQCLHFYVYKI